MNKDKGVTSGSDEESEEDSDDENNEFDDDLAKISQKIKCKFTIRT